MTDPRYQLKLAVERLCSLQEEAAHLSYLTAADPEASSERARVLDEIEAQRLKIQDLEAAL